jgi:4-amino-4-deoxy-L-arabinose transferase-like glycosyltransferase
MLASGRWRRPLQSPWYLAAAFAAVLPPVAFCLAREAIAPGYLAAVWSNDMSGRFLTPLDGHGGPPWYYLDAICRGLFFSAGPLALLAPLALLGPGGKARQGLLFSLCAAAGVLFVVSLSSTKLPQYMAPAYPFLAIGVAIAAHTALRAVDAGGLRPLTSLTVRTLVALVLAGVVAQGLYFRHAVLPERAFVHQALYGELLADLAAQGRETVSIVDSGVDAPGVPPGYSPQLRFYTLLWLQRGLKVDRVADTAGARSPVVASCDTAALPALAQLGRDIAHRPGCWAVSRGAPMPRSGPGVQ